jgi:hypothetical protein
MSNGEHPQKFREDNPFFSQPTIRWDSVDCAPSECVGEFHPPDMVPLQPPTTPMNFNFSPPPEAMNLNLNPKKPFLPFDVLPGLHSNLPPEQERDEYLRILEAELAKAEQRRLCLSPGAVDSMIP